MTGAGGSARRIATGLRAFACGLFWAIVELWAMRLVFVAMRVRAHASRRQTERVHQIYLCSGAHPGSALRRAQRDHAAADDSYERAVRAQLASDDANARLRFAEMEVERWT